MSVFLNNLDDFIAPSQACINPFVAGGASAKASATSKIDASVAARIVLQSDFSTTEYDLPPQPLQQPNLIRAKASTTGGTGAGGGGGVGGAVASVSLNDCLACSGCVTSAETVLIQEQSFSKLLAKLSSRAEDDCMIVVALSPQTRASLAVQLGMPSGELFLRIAAVLKGAGVTYVIDVSSAGDLALLEAREEFMLRLRNGHSTSWDAPPVTTAASSTRVHVLSSPSSSSSSSPSPSSSGEGAGAGAAIGGTTYAAEPLHVGPVSLSAQNLSLPMFVSSCPGWVCYAEKTQPQALPYMSTTKSAQQILGAVIKKLIAPQQNVYLVSVQPCFDKKLEASRLDFFHDDSAFREVDLVISTTELWELLSMQALESGRFASVAEWLASSSPDSPQGRDDFESMLRSFSPDGANLVAASDSNAGSGAFLDYVFRHAALEVCGVNLWATGADNCRPVLDMRVGRNPDVAEIEIEVPSSSAVAAEAAAADGSAPKRKLRFARAYGFRNIQSLLLKMKRGKCDVDFVEVMACPSGCVNGGGQLKSVGLAEAGSAAGSSRETPSDVRSRVASVDAELSSVLVRRPEDSPLARFVYAPERLSGIQSPTAVALLHTRYHAVPKLELLAPLAAKW